MRERDGVTVYAGSRIRGVKAALSGVVALLLIRLIVQMLSPVRTGPHTVFQPNGIVEGYAAVVAAAVVVLLIGFVRAFRVGIYLTDAGMTARTAYSTKSWRWDEIERASTKERTTRSYTRGLTGSMGTYSTPAFHVIPILQLVAGHEVVLRGLKVTMHEDAPNWVDDAMFEINRRIASRREGLGPGVGSVRPS